MRPARRRFASAAGVVQLVLCALALSACALPRPARVAPALYDLGQPQSKVASRPRIDATLLVPDAGAPAWLDTTGIAYRLAYQDATRVRSYANSRWADTPAMLVTEQFRSRLAASANRVVDPRDGVRADYALRVELEDFSQTFDAPDRSRVSARIRASLVDLDTHAVTAQHTFSAERDAAPRASGAAAALADASHRLLDEVLDWTAQNLKNRASRQTMGTYR